MMYFYCIAIWICFAHALPEPDAASRNAALGGIGVGARVQRGRDWREAYGDQDGGPGMSGTVIELRQWQSGRNVSEDTVAVRVRWDASGTVNAYRWSMQGAIRDLFVTGYRPVRPDESAPPSHESLASYYARQASGKAVWEALLKLRDETGGEKAWVKLKGWFKARSHEESRGIPPIVNPDDPCAGGWEGVSCQDGVLVGLDLSSVGLTGPVPAHTLCGSALGTRLASLSLARNSFSGPVPDELCACRQLRFLDMSHAGLSGPLPHCLGKLNLVTLSLADNALSGGVPPEWSALSGTNLQLDEGQGLTVSRYDKGQFPEEEVEVDGGDSLAGITIVRPGQVLGAPSHQNQAKQRMEQLHEGEGVAKARPGLRLLHLHNNPGLEGELPGTLRASPSLRVTCTGTGLNCASTIQ